MAEHISFSGTPSRVVVTELQDLLKEKLRDGQTVALLGIGRFGLAFFYRDLIKIYYCPLNTNLHSELAL